MPVTDLLPYDLPAYAAALDHLGQPQPIDGWPATMLRRAIPGADGCQDAMGPWPYSSAPPPDVLAGVLSQGRDAGIVTLRAVLRPDQPPSCEALRRDGFELVPLKEHFVFDPTLDLPERGARTRRNLRQAQRRWHVEPVALADHWQAIGDWHDALVARRRFDRITTLRREHFAAIAGIEGFDSLGAFDRDGLGAMLVACRSHASMHFHIVAGTDRVYRTAGFYALYEAAIRRWAGPRTLYLGGAPEGPDGDGIARFKCRFANRRAPVWMLIATPDPQACERLRTSLGPSRPGWFPPYRG